MAAVSSVALVATASAVLEANELSGRNAQVRAAAPVLASLMEEVRGTPFAAVASTFRGQSRTVTGIPGATATATFDVTDVDTGSTRWQVRRVDVLLR